MFKKLVACKLDFQELMVKECFFFGRPVNYFRHLPYSMKDSTECLQCRRLIDMTCSSCFKQQDYQLNQLLV